MDRGTERNIITTSNNDLNQQSGTDPLAYQLDQLHLDRRNPSAVSSEPGNLNGSISTTNESNLTSKTNNIDPEIATSQDSIQRAENLNLLGNITEATSNQEPSTIFNSGGDSTELPSNPEPPSLPRPRTEETPNTVTEFKPPEIQKHINEYIDSFSNYNDMADIPPMQSYSMNKNMGHCLIFNFQNFEDKQLSPRNCAGKDIEMIQNIMQSLQYNCQVAKDDQGRLQMTASQVMNLIEECKYLTLTTV